MAPHKPCLSNPHYSRGACFLSMILELWEQLDQLCLVNVNKMKQGGRQFFIWSHQNIEKIKNSNILSTPPPPNTKQNKHKPPFLQEQLTWAFGDSKARAQSESRRTWTLSRLCAHQPCGTNNAAKDRTCPRQARQFRGLLRSHYRHGYSFSKSY